MKNRINMKNHAGVTLVILVIIILLLIILSAVTISSFTGDKGLSNKAKEIMNNTGEIQNKVTNDIQSMKNEMKDKYGEEEVEIPEGLEVGSTVTYNPSGTYHWLHKYCSSFKNEKAEDGTTDAYDLLESGTGKNFNLAEWKVLSIDQATGKVEIVPSSPTTGTVYLGETQGYNNGVKLLNDACNSLYGNSAKGITARSINIGDIEKYMTKEAKTGENGVYNYVHANTKYNKQVGNSYTSNNSYPVIYAKEKKSVINGITPTDATLDLSDTLDRLIERSEGTAGAFMQGVMTTANSIQPTQTHWSKDAEFMETAFQEYTKKNNIKVKYYDLIIPKGTSTTYWVASRCVLAFSENRCDFYMRSVAIRICAWFSYVWL